MKWDSNNCDSRMAFICNSCDGKIEKYDVFVAGYNYSYTNKYCQSVAGTTVASIHSDTEMEEISALMYDVNFNYLWLGIHGNVSYAMEYKDPSVLSWYDGTHFDFGTNVTEYEYPWQGPYYALEVSQCVYAERKNDWNWRTASCNWKFRALCWSQSEICYKRQWNVIEGVNASSNSHWIWSGLVEGERKYETCELRVKSIGFKDRAVIFDRQWRNGVEPLIIEYQFKFENIGIRNNGEDSYTGITIYDDADCDEYYYFVIDPNNNKLTVDFPPTMGIDVDLELSVDEIYTTVDEFYTLKIELNHSLSDTIWRLYINEEFIHQQSDSSYNYLSNTGRSGYIGIINENVDVMVKSLYISGSIMLLKNNTNWYKKCTLNPTRSPTHEPTSEPTIDTSLYDVQYGVLTTIAFELPSYMQNEDGSISETISDQQLENILTNITRKIIHQEINANNLDDCVHSFNLTINQIISANYTSVSITATIFVCDRDSQKQLTILIARDNTKDNFVDSINDDSIPLSVEPDDINIEVEEITIKSIKVHEPDTTSTTESSLLNHQAEGNNITWVEIIILAASILFCLVCIFMVIVYIKLREDRIAEEKEKIEMQTFSYKMGYTGGWNAHCAQANNWKTNRVNSTSDVFGESQVQSSNITPVPSEPASPVIRAIHRHQDLDDEDKTPEDSGTDDKTPSGDYNKQIAVTSGNFGRVNANGMTDDGYMRNDRRIRNSEFVINGDDEVDMGYGMNNGVTLQ